MSNIDLASKHSLVQVQGRRGPEGDGMGSGASDSAAGRIHGRVRGAHRSRKGPVVSCSSLGSSLSQSYVEEVIPQHPVLIKETTF